MSSIKNVRPYDLWTGKIPRINHVRIIVSDHYDIMSCTMYNKAAKAYLIEHAAGEIYCLWVSRLKMCHMFKRCHL